jgi:hypothetical protein
MRGDNPSIDAGRQTRRIRKTRGNKNAFGCVSIREAVDATQDAPIGKPFDVEIQHQSYFTT